MTTAEYDAFGPWIYEVRTTEDVPPLFRDQPLDLAACGYVIKVPREIARRDATPQMDLYDHLIAAGPDGLIVLSRRPTGVSSLLVPYESIAAIEHSIDLLDGRLTLHTTTAQPEMNLRYNSSSRELVDALVAVLRERYLVDAPLAPAAPPPARALRLGDLGDADVALVTEQHAVGREDPAAVLLAAHPRRVVTLRETSGVPALVARAAHAAWPMTLQGALVCSDGREVQVLHRRHWWMRGRRPVHSVARTVIPVSRVESVSVRDDQRYLGVRVVVVRLGTTVLELPVPQGSDAETVLGQALLPPR